MSMVIIKGINNSGGALLELSTSIGGDDGLYVIVQVKDHETGDELSPELLIEDIDNWIDFLTNARDEAQRARGI